MCTQFIGFWLMVMGSVLIMVVWILYDFYPKTNSTSKMCVRVLFSSLFFYDWVRYDRKVCLSLRVCIMCMCVFVYLPLFAFNRSKRDMIKSRLTAHLPVYEYSAHTPIIWEPLKLGQTVKIYMRFGMRNGMLNCGILHTKMDLLGINWFNVFVFETFLHDCCSCSTERPSI